jgi:hypothetical protein
MLAKCPYSDDSLAYCRRRKAGWLLSGTHQILLLGMEPQLMNSARTVLARAHQRTRTECALRSRALDAVRVSNTYSTSSGHH